VPAPTSIRSPKWAFRSRIMPAAPAVLRVTSTTSTPPRRRASAASIARLASVWRMMATTPPALIRASEAPFSAPVAAPRSIV
jgi:hypothetical protein